MLFYKQLQPGANPKKRNMEISKESLEKTIHCHKDFACVKCNEICCTVIQNIDNKVIFVECEENVECSYKMSFGNSFICTCPTRKEINNKYGL